MKTSEKMKTPETLVRRTVKNSVSGTIAGIAITLVGHPFDTMKVRLQTQPAGKPLYKGLLDCFVKTLKNEGVGGLYKGVGSPLAGQMFFRATLFTSYYQISSLLTAPGCDGQRLRSDKYFLCGAYTGGVASLVEGPIDLFKTKMQIQILRAHAGENVSPYRNVFQAGYVIASQHGIRGVYQGLSATLMRNMPSFGIYFGVFELIRDRMTPLGGDVARLSTVVVASGVGGFFYWVFTYPTDVIKSSLQADESDVTKRRFRGISHCARTLYREEGGWRRFYRGFSPCLLRSVPAPCIMMVVLEKCRQLFP